MRALAVIGGWLALAASNTAWAYSLEDVETEWWTGSGANRVLLVIDFWPGNDAADSFAFGCRFDQDAISGLDLLDALQAANNGFSYAQSDGYLTDIEYVRNGTTYHAYTDWPNSWISYWLSDDNGETWSEAQLGPAVRLLHDGETDGWLAKSGDDWTSTPITPLVAPPIPGDMNCDEVVNGQDIDGFVLALFDPAGYAAQYPGCDILNGDFTADGVVNGQDIDGFVAALFTP